MVRSKPICPPSGAIMIETLVNKNNVDAVFCCVANY